MITEVKEKPILFSTEMVKAILEGKKSQTRRIMKPQPYLQKGLLYPLMNKPENAFVWEFKKENRWFAWEHNSYQFDLTISNQCPYGLVGSRLWVRETFATEKCWDNKPMSFFNNASDVPIWFKVCDPLVADFVPRGKWRPSIFMPRWASRINLEVTEVRVQRLQEITQEDCLAEGSYMATDKDDEGGFVNLWDSINIKRGYSWSSNPWVWAISFKRMEQK